MFIQFLLHFINYIVISRINGWVNGIVDLPSNFVLLCVKDEVALAERPSHAADVLNALPILFPRFVCLDQLVLELDQELHLAGEWVELIIFKLRVV